MTKNRSVKDFAKLDAKKIFRSRPKPVQQEDENKDQRKVSFVFDKKSFDAKRSRERIVSTSSDGGEIDTEREPAQVQ